MKTELVTYTIGSRVWFVRRPPAPSNVATLHPVPAPSPSPAVAEMPPRLSHIGAAA